MADTNSSPAAPADDSEPQVTFNVKSSSDAKHLITIALSATVADLKQKLASPDSANLPPERQRLIYSGRVLKDPDTIASCKIKDGNTVHLVRGAESNSRQTPANTSSNPSNPASQPASNVPSNIAAGTGAGNPLAQLTGARYAGFHGLPGAEHFGADGGMGAPPDPDQMLRMLEDPNFAQQMNEAMNNPAVIDMLRNNPMIRNNPQARMMIENPELRRMMMNPDMIRMQMQMQRAMGQGDGAGGGGAFPMPGQTDTTEGTGGATEGAQDTNNAGANPPGGAAGGAPANPFSALFGGGGQPGGGGDQQQANPFASMMGGMGGGGAGAGAGGGNGNQSNPLASMTQQLMQNPQMMQQMMQMMGGGGGSAAGESGGNNSDGANPFAGGFNPFMLGGMPGMGGAGMGGGAGAEQQQQPQDDRPPEVRYEDQLRQLNDMGFFEFERNVQALRRSGGSVQGAVEYLLS